MDAGKKAIQHIGVDVGKNQVIWGTYPLRAVGLALHPSYRLDRPNPNVMIPSGV